MSAVRARLWWLLTGLSLIIVLLAIGDIAGGAAFEPEGSRAMGSVTLAQIEAASPGAMRVLDFKARAGGVVLLAVGVLLSIVAWIPYRAGLRWAWFAMWVLPAWAAAFVVMPTLYGLAPGQSLTGPMLSGLVIAAIAAGALVLDAPRFKDPATNGR